MSNLDPPWKIRTRPCPFYSQGRCLFSDSCNFLHDVKIKVKSPVYADVPVYDPVIIRGSSRDIVQSPPSIHVSGVLTPPSRNSSDNLAFVKSYQSPPRSPRLSSLLLALGDVLGPEEEEVEETWEEGQPTYEEPESMLTDDSSEDLSYLAFSEGDTPSLAEVVATAVGDLDVGDASDTQSPAPVSSEARSLDSGTTTHGGEDESAPAAEQPLVLTISDGTSSAIPANEEEGGLLSPIEINNAAPRSAPLGSLEFFNQREDSVDSGYADNWTGPTPLALSPPRGEKRYSTLSILSSPFGTPSARVLSPTFAPPSSSHWPASGLFSPRAVPVGDAGVPVSQPGRDSTLDDLDSPSEYHRRHSHPGTESSTEDTVKPSAAPTLHTDEGSNQPDEGFDESFPDDAVGDASVTFLPGLEDTHHAHPPFENSPVVAQSLGSPVPSGTVGYEIDMFSDNLGSATDAIERLSKSPRVRHDGDIPPEEETPCRRSSRRNSQISSLEERIEPDALPATEISPQQHSSPSGDVPVLPPTPGGREELSPVAYTVGSSPDMDPDTSGEGVSSNAPSPFINPATADAPENGSNSTANVPPPSNDAHDTPSGLYDEYYSSVPVSPASSFSYISRAFDDRAPFTPAAESTPSSRVSTPSSSHVLSSPLPGRTGSHSASPSSPVPNVTNPSGLTSSFSSPQSSPTFPTAPSSAPVTASSSRPPSQFDSARLSLNIPVTSSPLASSASSSSLVGLGSERSSSSTRVPFGFRNSIRRHASHQSISSIRTSGSGSSGLARHRPPALTGIITDLDQLQSQSQSQRSSSRSSHRSNHRDSHSPSLDLATISASPRRLKPLRLSVTPNSSAPAVSAPAASSAFPPSLTTATTASSRTSSPIVSSDYSIANNHLLSSSHSTTIPEPNTHPIHSPQSAPVTHERYSPIPSSDSVGRHHSLQRRASQEFDRKQQSSRRSSLTHIPSFPRPSSRLSEQLASLHEEDEADATARQDSIALVEELGRTIRVRTAPMLSASPEPTQLRSPVRPPSVLRSPVHAIATPKPTLIFAIASDDVNEVRRVLESGEAGPNDDVGAQSALAFAVTTNQLKHKQEIVKLLLAHGANPSVLNDLPATASASGGVRSRRRSVSPSDSQPGGMGPAPPGLLENLDPATRYFIARADAPQTRRTSALIHRSVFRSLAKVRYDLIGQDRALEQLFRVLSMPNQAPIVVLLCGPSGHGKSLLARRFGSLLDVPTHTVNMTTLTSTHDIWRSYSMSPFEEPSDSALGDFLTDHQGKRCVVVLDEIEKVEDQKYLSSLLMPWELGRVSFGAGRKHVDVSKVIWLGTSNIGHDLVFEHQAQRVVPEAAMTREEYVDLMGLMRPQVSERLGPSLLSRVTTVLPFVPFSAEEKLAIAAEALQSLTADDQPALPSVTVEKLVQDSLRSYVPAEGARSLYRAVSNLLLDTI